ncbi:MAG: Crp/Fnr family transcriptional regulator [Anaerolineaceae bacterium]|nr:Crp/Fnr family transcriptional regulator [Anaerolineaceae bacterium]
MTTIFSSVPYFSELNPDDLLAVEQSAIRRTFQPEEFVLMEGDPVGGLYVVESGWLKVVKLSTGGREQVLNFLGAGDVFNGVAVFTESVNQASVIALEKAVVWWISADTMQNLLDTHPKLARYVIRDLAGRLQHLVGLVEDLSLRSVESRLARTLLEGTIDASVPRQKWATQTEMASRLGTVPDVLNRALRKLVEEGLIAVTRHQIRIIDPEGLKRKIGPV